jgi:hypothetical protein
MPSVVLNSSNARRIAKKLTVMMRIHARSIHAANPDFASILLVMPVQNAEPPQEPAIPLRFAMVKVVPAQRMYQQPPTVV